MNIWIRSKEFANMLGLLCGGLGVAIIGSQIPNTWVKWLGIESTILFVIICIFIVILAIRDAIFHPDKFWVELPWRG